MLIELLSPSNYVSFNVKLAEILGLQSAIYISELMNINDKAIRKSKMNDSGFSLDRDYVRKRTTLTVEEQLDIEQNLIKLSIIEKPTDDVNCIVLNINILTTLLMSTDDELLDNVEKLSKLKTKKSKATKAEAIRQNLKTNILTTNMELVEAYSDWIDAVYAKQGWMSKKAVTLGQSVVDKFSNHDLDVALTVISIAAMHGYVDMQWAINKYNEQYKVRREVNHTPKPVNVTPVELSSEAF
jgi:hypothetical protein